MNGANETAKSICVFCASSRVVDQKYFEAARDLGEQIVENNYTLVYGGTNIGLMGALADSVKNNGGSVVGIIPEKLYQAGIGNEKADELIITVDMRERKALMEKHSDVFVALPGGFGTLEEIFEVLTLKQLNYHSKPVVFLNSAGFYDALQAHFTFMYKHNFAKNGMKKLYHFSSQVSDLFEYLQTYKAEPLKDKWE